MLEQFARRGGIIQGQRVISNVIFLQIKVGTIILIPHFDWEIMGF